MAVVLGYDDSPGADGALATAITVAQRFGEELVLVFGVAPPGGVGEEYAAHRAALEELGERATSRALARAQEAGLEVRVQLVAQKPAEALVRVADECDASVIVVGTVGTSPIRGAILGSTPHKLLQLSTRPVLCVPVA